MQYSAGEIQPPLHSAVVTLNQAVAAHGKDIDLSAVVRVSLAPYPALGFEPIEDTGHGRRAEPAQLGQPAGRKGTLTVSQVEDAEVPHGQADPATDGLVQPRQLSRHISQGTRNLTDEFGPSRPSS